MQLKSGFSVTDEGAAPPVPEFDWDSLGEMPSAGPDFLLDTKCINARLKSRSDNPYRLKTGDFAVPTDCSEGQFEQIRDYAANRFIEMMSKEEAQWDLVSRLRLTGPFLCYEDPGSAIPKLGYRTYRWQGIFRHTKSLKSLRFEVPLSVVKQAPDHTISLQEAVKAHNLALPPERVRG